MSVSACGCVWERQPGFGDVIVQQCDKHYQMGNSEKSRKAAKAADRAVLKLRLRGVVPWPK